MKWLNGCLDWIRCHLQKEKVNKFSIVIISLYYYIGLLAYFGTPIKRYFVSTGSLSILARALTTAMVCIYSILVIIVNREKIQWKWVVIFVYVLLFTLLSTAISSQVYKYAYVSSLYRIIHTVTVDPGYSRIFTMFFTSISDFALAFCFMFVLPIVINKKRQLIVLLLPLVIIGLIECAYSLVFQKAEYIKLFEMTSSEYGGYAVNITASFSDKEEWGSFLTICFISSLFCIHLFNNKNKIYKTISVSMFLFSIILFVFTVMSLCKTAIMAQFFSYLIYFAYIVYAAFKKNKVIFFVLVGVFTITVVFLICLFTMQSLQNLPVINKVYKILNNYILARLYGSTLFERFSIWYTTVQSLRTYNLFFGLSKGGVWAYTKAVLIDGHGIHNGFAYFLLSYGVFGFSVFLILLAIVIKRILSLRKCNSALMTCSFAAFICAIVFSLVEGDVFIISGSAKIFIYNVVLCSFTSGYFKKEVKLCNETSLSYN